MSRLFQYFVIVFVSVWVLGSIPVFAEESKEKHSPRTITDPAIPLKELDIIAAPMTVEQLTVEADGWLELVRGVAQKVADAKLRILRETQQQADKMVERTEEQESDQPEAVTRPEKAEVEQQTEAQAEQAAEQKKHALDELNALRAERAALIKRLDIILQRINQKIGLNETGKEKDEVLVYRRYINAVGGIKLDVSDAETAIATITGWLTSTEGGLRWAKNIAAFVIIVFAFALLGRFISKATRKALEVSGDQSVLLTEFLVGTVRRLVLFIGILVGLSALEISIGPLLAVIGAAGFVVAFALQSTLSNFAGGLMIMFYRPFDVDDVIEAAGINGKVRSLNLVSTTITTFDNKRMVVPNNEIWGNIITNATGSTERRVDMVFGIGYEDDIDHAKKVLEEIADAHPLVLKAPAPVIQLHELADSSVNFICRPWTKTGDYWTVYWDITRSVKERFDAEGLSIPFPQRDVHVYPKQKTQVKSDSQIDKRDTTQTADQMGMEETESNPE